MTPRTRSQIGKASRAKGAAFERAVANAVRPWFPEVRRSRDNGSATTADTGDLAGTHERLYWSLKDVEAAASSPDGLILGWLVEASHKGPGCMPLLVVKRKGHADPLRSWCWLWLGDLAELLGTYAVEQAEALVRLELRAVLDLLADKGVAQYPPPDTIAYPPTDGAA